VVETKSSHTHTMDLCRSMPRNKCSEPECIFLTMEEEEQLCFGHKMALTWNKCSITDCNFLTEKDDGQFCLVHRPEQEEHIIGNNMAGEQMKMKMQKEEVIVKCDSCDFKTKGSKRGRLMKRLEKHQEVCKAAVAEQGDSLKNSVVEEVEKISEGQQLVGVY
jgi:hypothetical protein